jgi:hypothetical protein
VRGTDGTSRNKQRLDGISFTLKISADGLHDVFLPFAVYRLSLSEKRAAICWGKRGKRTLNCFHAP